MAARKKPRSAVRVEPPRPKPGWEPTLLLALAAFALVGSVGTTGQAQAVDLAAVWSGVAAVFAAGLLLVKGPVMRAGRLALAWTALLVWLLVAALASGRGWSAVAGESTNMLGFGTLLALTATAVAGAAYAPGILEALRRYGWWVLVAEMVLAAAQIAGGATPAGTLANSTYLGEAALLLLPFTVASVERSPSINGRLRLGAAALTLAVLAASGSRVAAAVALVWALWAVARQRTLAPAVRGAVAAGVVSVVGIAAYVFARGEFAIGRSLLGERPAIWRLAFEAIRVRPVFGWGPDGFLAGASRASTVALAQAGDALTLRPGATDPHDLLVWVAVSAGVVGVALSAWFAAEVGVAWRASARAGTGSSAALWAVAGCTVVFMTAPAALQVAPLFALILGASLGAAPHRRRAFTLPRTALVALLVALALGSAAIAADAAARATYERYGAGQSPARSAGALAASRLFGVDAHLAYLASIHAGFAGATQPAPNDRADLESARRAASLDGHNAFYALEYARTLQFYSEPERTVSAAYEDVFARYPAFPLAHAEYAVFLARSGRTAQAEEHLAIAQLARDADGERDRAIAAAREILDAARR